MSIVVDVDQDGTTLPTAGTYLDQNVVVRFSSKRGKAVVFGDSLFDGSLFDEGDRYNFADYLRKQGIYTEVADYAIAGTGWGNTKSSESGENLFELLQSPSVLAEVSAANAIYISLGANDIISRVFSDAVPEPDVRGKVAGCLNTIYGVNPSALIYFISAINIDMCGYWYNILSSVVTVTAAQKEAMAENALLIHEAVAACPNNLKILEICFPDYCATADGVHPTAESALNAYDQIVYHGAYRDKKLRQFLIHASEVLVISQSDFTKFAGYISNGMLPADSEEITGYMIVTDSIVVEFVPIRIKNLGTHAVYGYRYDTVQDMGGVLINLILEGRFDPDNPGQGAYYAQVTQL